MNRQYIIGYPEKKNLKKTLTCLSLLIILSACSTKHNTDIIVEKEEHLMHRQEVINAIEDCKTANLRPILFFSKRYVNDKPIPMVADVTCAPRSGY